MTTPRQPGRHDYDGPSQPANYRPIKLLTVEDLIEMGVYGTAQAAANDRYRGEGPRYVKLGEGPKSRVRYIESDIHEFIQSHTVEPKKNAGE